MHHSELRDVREHEWQMTFEECFIKIHKDSKLTSLDRSDTSNASALTITFQFSQENIQVGCVLHS